MKGEPSLFRKIVDVYWERAKARKALRLLTRQEWSVDFITMLCVRSAKNMGKPCEILVEAPNGTKLIVRSQNVSEDDMQRYTPDEDILNRLDDDAAVDEFIRRHGK